MSMENVFDCPGIDPNDDPKIYGGNITSPCSYNRLVGKWDFQKDGMHTRPNTLSNGFSKNQIKIIDDRIRRIIRQEMRENRDYYYDSADTYNDQQ